MRQGCEARLIDKDVDIDNRLSAEVTLGLIETGTRHINKELETLGGDDDLSVTSMDSLGMYVCNEPAVDFVDYRGLRTWLCAAHYDEYIKRPFGEDFGEDEDDELLDAE